MTQRYKKKTVALVQGGLGAESEISLMSAQAVAQAFEELNIHYTVVSADTNLLKKLSLLKLSAIMGSMITIASIVLGLLIKL